MSLRRTWALVSRKVWLSDHPEGFEARSVRAAWDAAADAYAEAQSTGLDYYRLDFFGPAQLALCGEVGGYHVLDVGCGTGYFARELARRGASVRGIDISLRMIEHARRAEEAEPLGVTYVVDDAANLGAHFDPESFDLAAACLSLQDMPRIPDVLRAVRTVLRPAGRMVASVAHPCTDTPFREWAKDASGRKRWLCVDRYFERGPVRYEWNRWSYPFWTTAYHATLADWFGWVVDAGFAVEGLHEPSPTDEALARHPDLEDAARVPYYLMFDLRRSAPAMGS